MNTGMAVIVPSRGRPTNIARLAAAWKDTAAAARLIVCVDDDDPQLAAYRAIGGDFDTVVGPRLRLGGTLNDTAPRYAKDYAAVGFMGDDHLPRTHGWDQTIATALADLGTGVVYGNDLVHGGALPTAVFMTSNIITKLGYMVPPGMVHLYLDNFWLELGRRLGMRYLPDVVIEHLHPLVGTAPTDAGYAEVNAPELYEADRDRFTTYMTGRFATDMARFDG